MQSDIGKLFIGGISWDTNEERLHEYFSRYGEVLESVIMRDRATGRARGFGFLVFADPAVAERVVKEKHNIDGRMVEAKKAVPRGDQSKMSRSSSSLKGSPSPGQTRKIFVGGLASTVTESEFKRYFEQFGTVADVVVMYDHNTKRPRGFGFITYESEDSVDKVLLRSFHQLNGKMVEVKRAVPKELSPSLSPSTLGAFPYGLTQSGSLLNAYAQRAFSPGPLGGYDVGMDTRFSPIATGRSGFATYGSAYGMGLNFEPTTTGNYNSRLNPYYVGNSSRFGSPISFDGGDGSNISLFSSNPRNLWGNGGLSPVGSGNGVIGGGLLGNASLNLGGSPVSPQDGANIPTQTGNLGYGSGGYGRNTSARGPHAASNGGYDVTSSDLYAAGGSVYGGDPTWLSEQEGSGSFGGYGDVQVKSSPGYVGGYSVTRRQPDSGING